MFENFGGGSEPATSQHATPTSDLPSPQEIDLGRGVQLAQATPAGEPIGAVEELLGAVVLTRSDGSTSAAAPGTPVYLNDVVTTPVGGAVEIRFVDGTRFSLGQNGEMTLDQLVYNPGGGGNELDLSVAQGAFTFVTGAIAGAPGEGMEVRVPVGTIGIRGTAVGGGPDFSTADPTDYTVVLLPEPGGRVGRIVLTDLFGRSVILDDALEGMDISSLGLAPGEPVQLTREQVIALLGLSIENIEDILNEVENFQLEESPEDDVIPEGGPEQEGQLFNNVPNQGGVRTFAGRTLSLGELTSLLTIGDQQGFGDRSGGPLGGFDPDGGLGNDGNDGGPDDGSQGSDGPLGSDDPIIDDGGGDSGEQPAGFILLTGGDGDDLLDASGFAGPTNITGNGGSDILFGSEFDDILNGGDGDDLLDAGAGNDQVNGGGGDDILIGGSGQGNDALDGGAGNDWVVYTSATQPITVNLGAGIAFGDPAIGSDTLANIENVIGGKGSDSITGNGEDNVLMGGEGGDTLTGLGGDDALFGGAGNDTAVFTGNRDDYTIEVAQGEGGFFITDNRQGAENDGTDFVAEDIEVLRFADGDVAVAPHAVGDTHVISEAQQSVENGAAIKTTVNVTAGAVLSFQWNFLDSEPNHTEDTFQDFAVLVIDGQVFKLADVADADTDLGTLAVQFEEETGYATYTFMFSTGGEHSIGFAVLNEGDDLFNAGLLLDSVQIVDAFEEGFENGIHPDIWQTVGDVSAVGALDGISPPGDDQQALLVSNGASASAIEQFLGLPPGALSETGNQPVAIGNVLDNDGTGGVDADIVSLSYDGNETVTATAVGSIVTYAATDGSWKMEFDLSSGDYTFTVLEPLAHSGIGSLSFPFTYTLKGITGVGSSAPLTIVITDGVPNAVDDSATVTAGGDPIGGNVLFNDGFSPDGAWVTSITVDGQTYGVGIEPAVVPTLLGGELVMAGNGEWSYTPPSNDTGSESFTYTVIDSDGDPDTAFLHVTVTQSTGGSNAATEGNDILTGTDGVDEIDALGGDDHVTGLSGSDILIGGEGNDTLLGNEGNDELYGNNGTDFLYGNEGDDELYGGAGDDFLAGGQGYNFLDGGDGTDYISFVDADTGISINLVSGIAFDNNDDVFDDFENIENVIGSANSDQIDGDDDPNTIIGGGGADVINAGGGDDILIVDDENELASLEVLDGGDGFDTLLIGGEGSVINLSSGYAISNIERLDISGIGANSVALTVEDVLNQFNGVLEIVGDSDDSVTSLGQGWEIEGSEPRDGILFNHYTAADGTASLYVSADSNANLDPNIIVS